jgi:hypothetical protein
MSDNSISFVTVEIYILLNTERYKSRSIVSSSLIYSVTKTLCYRLFSTLVNTRLQHLKPLLEYIFFNTFC